MIKRDNQCQGKEVYLTKESANITVTHLNKMGGHRLNSYTCGVCGLTHTGHNSKGKKMKTYSKKNKSIDYEHHSTIHLVDLENKIR